MAGESEEPSSASKSSRASIRASARTMTSSLSAIPEPRGALCAKTKSPAARASPNGPSPDSLRAWAIVATRSGGRVGPGPRKHMKGCRLRSSGNPRLPGRSRLDHAQPSKRSGNDVKKIILIVDIPDPTTRVRQGNHIADCRCGPLRAFRTLAFVNNLAGHDSGFFFRVLLRHINTNMVARKKTKRHVLHCAFLSICDWQEEKSGPFRETSFATTLNLSDNRILFSPFKTEYRSVYKIVDTQCPTIRAPRRDHASHGGSRSSLPHSTSRAATQAVTHRS